MNILMLTSNDVGGVTNHIVLLSRKIMEHNSENKIVIGCEYGERTQEISNEFKTYVMNFHSKNPKEIFKTLALLKKIIIKHNIDIVHCHYRTASLYMHFLKPFINVDYVWTNHLVPIPYDFFHRVMTFYGKKAIAIGKDTEKFLNEKLRIPKNDIEIIYHGVNLEKFNNEYNDKAKLAEYYGITPQEKVIVLLGRLDPIKGHEFLLNSIYDIENIKIIFTGTGSEEYVKRLKDLIASYNIEEKVIFSGVVNTKNEYY